MTDRDLPVPSAGVRAEDPAATSGERFEVTTFRADSALLRELGERLVGQPHIALAELIKNAYDADATYCVVDLESDRITVIDNGHGMSREEFLKYWMTIGTRNKQRQGSSRVLGRNVTGSKGVGRLSAQFLAHDLEIVTASGEDEGRELQAFVDWDAAIDAGSLTEAQAHFRTLPRTTTFADGGSTGTRVVMKGLKQRWDRRQLEDLGKQLWMIQSPLPQYGRVRTDRADPKAFRVELKSWQGELTGAFERQMKAALENWDAVVAGRLQRVGGKSLAHVTVRFRSGETYSEDFDVDPLVDSAEWTIRVFRLQGRQFEGVKVSDARDYFERFGGVQVYDAGFRLPYYGVEQDWLGIEYDHSHRRNKSALLPDRLHVRRALNDLPTQGRLFGVVSIDTGREAREADAPRVESGEFLKIQVTRDRLVANEAYRVLREAVRWSLDYYATRERLREELVQDLARPDEAATDKIGRVRELAARVSEEHPTEDAEELLREVTDLSRTIEDERRADDAARALLGPLASAGMAALALEHENRKELRLGRALQRRLGGLAEELRDARISTVAEQFEGWLQRMEGTRRIFVPLLDADDRDRVEALALGGVLRQIVDGVRPLVPTVSIAVDVPRDIFLPAATFAEWYALFQNVLVNAGNATLDSAAPRILCTGGRTGRSAWARVSDSGVGVDWNASDALFEPFARAIRISEERRGLGLGGIGLGLTIVRMIADQRRCKVRFVEPEPPWATTFQLSWSSAS